MMVNENEFMNKLDELIKWAKVIAKPQLRALIIQNIETDLESAVFELSNGELSTRDISGTLKKQVSHATVATYWQKWFRVGIVEPSTKYPGRFRKICSLEEVGITLPPILKSLELKESNMAVVENKENNGEKIG